MSSAIIVIILIIVIVLAVKSSMKHFKGEGGCCGGGGDTPVKIPKKELKGPKIGEMTVSISGMHCDHCVQSVTKAINRIEGASANVSLKKKEAVVSYDRAISKDAIKQAVEAEGFQVTGIQE